MATEAILKLIQEVRKNGTNDQAALAVAALNQLAAIHRAAKALASEESESADNAIAQRGMTKYLAAMDLMESIAEEAPEEEE